MSRSIHATRRALRELRDSDFAQATARRDAISAVRQRLRRKRAIKAQVAAERRRAPPPAAPTPVDAIAIETLDEGPRVHHGASVDDVRAVLAALPEAATAGIHRVQLALGAAYMAEHDGARDPHTGRLSHALLPGVYAGTVLGTYTRGSGLISVYAFVLDPACLPLPPEACWLYLRLHALSTLVHEVAHHHDETTRVARGRWLADRRANAERYAEQMQHRWERELVVPYLAARYPREVESLLAWIDAHGGLRLALADLLSDPRRTRRDGLTRIAMDAGTALCAWLTERAERGAYGAVESRLALAWELHLADQYAHCLAVLDRIARDAPEAADDLALLDCRADTLEHLGRYDEALALARAVLARDPLRDGAWRTTLFALEGLRDHAGMLAQCARWEAAVEPAGALPLDRSTVRALAMFRAVAHCGLRDDPAMEVALARHAATFVARDPAREAARRAGARRAVFRRAGRPFAEA